MGNLEGGRGGSESEREGGKLNAAAIAFLATLMATVGADARAAMNNCELQFCPTPRTSSLPKQTPDKKMVPANYFLEFRNVYVRKMPGKLFAG